MHPPMYLGAQAASHRTPAYQCIYYPSAQTWIGNDPTVITLGQSWLQLIYGLKQESETTRHTINVCNFESPPAV